MGSLLEMGSEGGRARLREVNEFTCESAWKDKVV